jgi:hypothetical protein
MCKVIFFISFLLTFTIISSKNVLSQDSDSTYKNLQPKLIMLNLDSLESQSILTSSKESLFLNSGLVILKPEKTVGQHNTRNYEEIIIVWSICFNGFGLFRGVL